MKRHHRIDNLRHARQRAAALRLLLHGLLVLTCLASCSITAHLPAGEVLYTGVDRIDHHKSDTVDAAVGEVVATALEVAPNSALLGSAYHMSPLPFGLWCYNGLYTEREHGLRHWLWSHFKSDPTLLSAVNPRLRAQAAEAALKDEGYFDASVSYDTVYASADSLKARVRYGVTYHHHARFGAITYMRSPYARIDSIISHTRQHSLLHSGDRFSAANLEAERSRIADVLQDSGYYFFQPEYIRFLGDSTRHDNTVDLRILVGVGADRKSVSPCTIDSVHFVLDMGAGLKSHNADTLRFVTVGYNGPQMIQTRYLRRSLGFKRHALCTPDRLALNKTLMARLNTFKYTTTELQLLRLASDTLVNDTTSLRLQVNATYNYPWTGTTEFGCVYKDNQQVGPGATATFMRRNLWGGGELLSMQLTGSYEWRTGNQSDDGSLINSYELGAKVKISVPRLQLPRLFRPDRENPVTSAYSMSFDWMRRAGLFEMIKAGASVEYGFSLNRYNTFTVTPIKLNYVSMVKRTGNFNRLISNYSSLAHSFEDQFIPQLQIGWTYDNSSRTEGTHRSTQYVSVMLAEAGGLCDVVMGQVGSHHKQGERQLFFQPFSQFVKATFELRNNYSITDDVKLASRILGGVGYAYGNSTALPYTEQFFIGGPNSLRGFSVRGVGPGSVTYYNVFGDSYSYLDRVGDVKLEGNVELRFPLAGSLYGALFADAGNIWRLRKTEGADADTYRDGETMQGNVFGQLATDCGLGFRLDLGMLVVRFDIGVPLHDPGNYYDRHYFNCSNDFFGNLGYNLAVGYPF